MFFNIRPMNIFYVLLISLLMFGGCTIAPKFTPTTESSKTFQVIYQDSVSRQAAPAKGQNETLKSLEK